MYRLEKILPLIVLMLIGLAFGVVGATFVFVAPPQLLKEAERVESFAPATVALLQDIVAGREVLIEGHISPDNYIQQGTLVAYVIEEREVDNEGDESWVARGQVRPSLSIDLPDGSVRIDNNTYELVGNLVIEGDSNVRYKGFQLNNPITSLGILRSVSDGVPYLEAEFIAMGTQNEFIATKRTDAQFFRWFGLLFMVLGVGLLIPASVIALRFH